MLGKAGFGGAEGGYPVHARSESGIPSFVLCPARTCILWLTLGPDLAAYALRVPRRYARRPEPRAGAQEQQGNTPAINGPHASVLSRAK